MLLKIFTDGGSRGNPGPGASGALVYDENDKLVDLGGMFFPVTTNNNAEYNALMIGAKLAAKIALSSGDSDNTLNFFLDSELAVKQMRGEYKVSDANIKALKAQILTALSGIKQVTYTHIRREFNKQADKLVNLIVDTKLSNDL